MKWRCAELDDDDVYVTVPMQEHEFDKVLQWLEEQPIKSFLADLYDRMIDAMNERIGKQPDADEDDDEEDVGA